jgi:hypothetical protein
LINQISFLGIGVILYPLDRSLDAVGENQPALEWRQRPIINAEEVLQSFHYVELESIELKKLDLRILRPLYSAKLCQLQFQFTIRVNRLSIYDINLEENITLLSQSFGLCSHAQYYPEHVAKVLLYEVTQMPQAVCHFHPYSPSNLPLFSLEWFDNSTKPSDQLYLSISYTYFRC